MRIRIARDAEDLETIRTLFREYASGANAPACFTTFEDEIASLPGAYAPPHGRLYLTGNDQAAGCIALRRLDPETAEIKRLYVREPRRRNGLGRDLALAAIAAARETGASRVVLDTLPSMERAQALYRALGFREIPPYLAEPTPGAICFELRL